jgi:hypothetical protein
MGWRGVGGRRVSFLSGGHTMGTAIRDVVWVALVGETGQDQAVFHLLQACSGFSRFCHAVDMFSRDDAVDDAVDGWMRWALGLLSLPLHLCRSWSDASPVLDSHLGFSVERGIRIMTKSAPHSPIPRLPKFKICPSRVLLT